MDYQNEEIEEVILDEEEVGSEDTDSLGEAAAATDARSKQMKNVTAKKGMAEEEEEEEVSKGVANPVQRFDDLAARENDLMARAIAYDFDFQPC